MIGAVARPSALSSKRWTAATRASESARSPADVRSFAAPRAADIGSRRRSATIRNVAAYAAATANRQSVDDGFQPAEDAARDVRHGARRRGLGDGEQPLQKRARGFRPRERPRREEREDFRSLLARADVGRSLREAREKLGRGLGPREEREDARVPCDERRKQRAGGTFRRVRVGGREGAGRRRRGALPGQVEGLGETLLEGAAGPVHRAPPVAVSGRGPKGE